MELYVLNQNYEKIAVIDYAKSIIWTKRYCETGDCEIYLPAETDALAILKKRNILQRADRPTDIMQIQTVRVATDEEKGNYMTVTGKTMDILLAQRIIWTQTNLSGSVVDCTKKILNENLIKPSNSARKIAGVTFESGIKNSESVKKQITGDNLLDAFIELLTTYKYGYKATYEKGIKITAYQGVDRSGSVVFSPDIDNLIESEYSSSVEEYKNVALVAGEGEGVSRKTYTVGSAAGYDRFEEYVDARDISSDTDNGTLSNAEYNKLLATKGQEKLAETIVQEKFSGTIEPGINYAYGIDYDLGDIVKMINEYGMSANARITEVIESWDESGYTCIPTFDTEEV